jgi:hypothetical protein
MPLNLSVGDADFTPYIKYNAKAGRFYIKPEGATEEVEINNPLLAFDMANIRTGWLYYAEGSGPEKVWDPSPTEMAARPPGPKKFKRGFEVMVLGNAVVPGTASKIGLREFSSTAANVISSILRMHAEYEAGLAENQLHVPVYSCRGVKPITGAYGVNYEPLFVLQQWVPRSKVSAFDDVLRECLPKVSQATASAPRPAPLSGRNGGFTEIDPPPVDDIPF